MTETKTLNRDTPTEKPTDKPAEAKRILDLSATQLTGGALAAMTSAVIGAQLGVAGTIIGAAIGSVVAGVAGSLYTASLKRTKEKITSVIVGRAGDTTVQVATVSDDTAVLGSWSTTALPPAAAAPPSPQPVAAHSMVDGRGINGRGSSAQRLPWRGILVSTAAVFLLAIAGITGFELASGHTLSGGEGTTVSQVSEGRSGGSDVPSESPSVTPSSQTSTEASPSASASSEPSSSATSEPSAEATANTAPSNEPTQSTEQSSSSEPTASGNMSAASGGTAAAPSTGATTVAGG